MSDAAATVKVKDERIAYGALCTWWDSIRKVGKNEVGLPCCPHCRGVLFETKDEATWFAAVDEHERLGNMNYRAMIEWSRGKCFRNYALLESAYLRRNN